MNRSRQGPNHNRRQHIVSVARRLILGRGLRGTSMEAIALTAEIAKPTLYAYFPDKNAVFAAIVADLAATIRSGFDAAMATDADPAARIGMALGAKYKAIARLLEGAPHAAELYGEDGQNATASSAVLEDHIEAAISRALDEAGVVRPRQLTRLLLAAASGIGRRAAPSEIGPAIRLLTERLLRPELAGSP